MNNITSYKGDGRYYLRGVSHQPVISENRAVMSSDRRMAILREMGIIPEEHKKVKPLTSRKPLSVTLEV